MLKIVPVNNSDNKVSGPQSAIMLSTYIEVCLTRSMSIIITCVNISTGIYLAVTLTMNLV